MNVYCCQPCILLWSSKISIVACIRSHYFPDLWFSVLTPYYKEDVLYSDDELTRENEDGISILFYLQKIYPGAFQSHF